MDKNGNLRIALAQINPTVGDFKKNISKVITAIGHAKEKDTDIVTFPEFVICGYPPEDLLLKPQFIKDNKKALSQVIKKTGGITALVGFADSQNGRVYNAAAVISDTHLVGTYYKVELPNYGVFDEMRYFSPGSECIVLDQNNVRCIVTICEDIWIEGGKPEQWAVKNKVKIIFNISASPFHAGKLALRRRMLIKLAKRTKTFVCYNNLVGGQDELVFDGGSLIVSPEGELMATGKSFQEDLVIADVEIKDLPLQPSLKVACKECQHIVLKSKRYENRKAINAPFAEELGRIEEVYEAIVTGTRDYVLKNGFGKVVVGLSGGIDSALTAAIAVFALGNGNVTGVTMPSQYTSKETLSDAEILAGNLNIQLITVPVKSIFSAYIEELKGPFKYGRPGKENENLQARIRGNILMSLSNRFGWLVLSTGNKSEVATGYCTLYGDMAGGFSVIKDVPKTLVYELCEYINKKRGTDIIPASILKRPPTAELRPHQKDEDTLPPYSVLDPILKAYVEEDRSQDEIVKMDFDRKIVRDVIQMVDSNEYKRRQSPPGIKITPKAFGKDRRLPITNRYYQ